MSMGSMGMRIEASRLIPRRERSEPRRMRPRMAACGSVCARRTSFAAPTGRLRTRAVRWGRLCLFDAILPPASAGNLTNQRLIPRRERSEPRRMRPRAAACGGFRARRTSFKAPSGRLRTRAGCRWRLSLFDAILPPTSAWAKKQTTLTNQRLHPEARSEAKPRRMRPRTAVCGDGAGGLPRRGRSHA